MNYKIMKRPMFKLGGKAASQGTGITSGLDEKVNMAIGGGVIKGQNMGAREGFEDPKPDFSSMTIKDLMDYRTQNIDKQMSGLDSMKDIIRLQALGNLATNVLPNIESGGFTAVTDFLKDPMTTQTAIQGLTGLKKIDLKGKQLEAGKLDKILSDKINLKKIDQADRKLDIAEKNALVKTATQIKFEAGVKARSILSDAGVDSPNMLDPMLQKEYFSLSALAGDTLSVADAKKLAINAVLRQQEENNARRADEGLSAKDFTEEEFQSKVDFLTGQFLLGFSFKQNQAEGGRVDRAMGTPMMGEQPMNQGMGMAQTTKQDVAMETEGQGNNVYAMLRARLPQEISDEVVKLIAYNKEAFADFASIKNQEDVSSFNEKYGVQLVIDVAPV